MSDRLLSNWIESYLEYTSNTEPRPMFRRWAAISTIAAVLQRKCFFNLGVEEFFPNMYVVLVGPPAARKGTAMKPAKKFLDKLGINLAADETSRQKLVKALIDNPANDTDELGNIYLHCSLTIFSTELTVFIGYNNIELLTILCKWFDCENRFVYETIGRGKEEAANVWVNLFGATTPTLLQSSMPQDAIGSGFASRTIFVFEENKEKLVVYPGLSDKQKRLEGDLLLDLAKIHMIRGQFKLDAKDFDEFMDSYAKWRIESEKNPPFTEPRLKYYTERRIVHFWKLCMIYCAARIGNRIINMEDFRSAIETLEETEKKMPQVFAGLGTNTLAAIQIQVMKIVAERKEIPMSELMTMFYNDVGAHEMAQIVATLEKMKFAQMEIVGKKLIYTREDK